VQHGLPQGRFGRDALCAKSYFSADNSFVEARRGCVHAKLALFASAGKISSANACLNCR
jgi:hypothetical protein